VPWRGALHPYLSAAAAAAAAATAAAAALTYAPLTTSAVSTGRRWKNVHSSFLLSASFRVVVGVHGRRDGSNA